MKDFVATSKPGCDTRLTCQRIAAQAGAGASADWGRMWQLSGGAGTSLGHDASEPRSPAAPWPRCGHGAAQAAPVGCRGIHVPGHDACLAHLDDADRTAYLATLAPGADIDHRGTVFTEEPLSELLTALRDLATDRPCLGRAQETAVALSRSNGSLYLAGLSGLVRLEHTGPVRALCAGVPRRSGGDPRAHRVRGFREPSRVLAACSRWRRNRGRAGAAEGGCPAGPGRPRGGHTQREHGTGLSAGGALGWIPRPETRRLRREDTTAPTAGESRRIGRSCSPSATSSSTVGWGGNGGSLFWCSGEGRTATKAGPDSGSDVPAILRRRTMPEEVQDLFGRPSPVNPCALQLRPVSGVSRVSPGRCPLVYATSCIERSWHGARTRDPRLSAGAAGLRL